MKTKINEHHVQHFFIFLFCAVLAFAIFYKSPAKETIVKDTEIRKVFPEVKIAGKSLYVADIKTREVLYKKNEDKSLPIASIAKIMTAVAVLDIFSKDDLIKIPKAGLDAEGNSGLKENEEWKVGDLISYMMTVSSNDAAYSLMLLANQELSQESSENSKIETFIDRMNKKARDLGMENSYYYNTSGLDRGEFVGSYSTAHDVATIATYAYQKYPEIFSVTANHEWQVKSQSGIEHDAVNTNKLTKEMHDIVFSKTGFTDNSGGSLVVIVDDKVVDPFVVVVLDSTLDERFVDVKNLIRKAKEYMGGPIQNIAK